MSDQIAEDLLDPQSGDDPLPIASSWLEAAGRTEINDPNAISLATASADGAPNVRVMLLKEIMPASGDDRGGFVFYTNYESAKGGELASNPRAAILFHWKSLRRQVRVRGRIEKVDAEQADAYYNSRPYESRIGAWASQQSRPLESREALIEATKRLSEQYPENPPRPPHWGGFRLTPDEIEFWVDGAFRLHDRFIWSWDGGKWSIRRVSP